MRLSEITLQVFMEPVVEEFDSRSKEGQDIRRQASERGFELASEAKAGDRDYTMIPVVPDPEWGTGRAIVEIPDDNGKLALFFVQTRDNKWQVDTTDLVDGKVLTRWMDSHVLKHLIENQDRLSDFLDLESECVSSFDIELRLLLHKKATVEAFNKDDNVHPENYDRYIAPYIDPETRDWVTGGKSQLNDTAVIELKDITYNSYCYPNRRVIREDQFGTFEKNVISEISEKLDDYQTLLSAKGAERFLKDHEILEIRKSPVEDCRIFVSPYGQAIMTDGGVQTIKATIIQGTTFVPKDLRGQGCGADLLRSLGGHFKSFLAPSHFSEGGIGSRRSAHRKEVLEAHQRGDWLRPVVKAHYADILTSDAALDDDSEPAALAM
ncbi:hypothetical protein [Sulfitobacter sp. R18_1]|uniref:hypothetical protein n=1 Tax=Sulfitobacter sp. R18_1 TaxID=2821104 RepID=UPI001ADB31C9|nr:hypothetical protein [Sulfitobacter sp. R18_1]MBO9428255.1 hypothetical protein [Sulfitobacter sp. R18_1]